MSDDDNRFGSPIPFHMRKDFKKSVFAEYHSTDYSPSEVVVPNSRIDQTSYRLDEQRPNGNVMFKRYPDGKLDLEWCKNLVIDCLNKAKSPVPLTDIEKLVLAIHFPDNFQYDDTAVAEIMRRVNIRISNDEAMIISVMVANHIYYSMVRVAGLQAGAVAGSAP